MERKHTLTFPVNYTPQELGELRIEEETGRVPKGTLANHFEEVNKAVFGHDAKKDRKGNYQEQGIGAKGHETANHFAALARAVQMGLEPKNAYADAVIDFWKRDPKRAEKFHLPRPEAFKQQAA